MGKCTVCWSELACWKMGLNINNIYFQRLRLRPCMDGGTLVNGWMSNGGGSLFLLLTSSFIASSEHKNQTTLKILTGQQVSVYLCLQLLFGLSWPTSAYSSGEILWLPLKSPGAFKALICFFLAFISGCRGLGNGRLLRDPVHNVYFLHKSSLSTLHELLIDWI